METMLDDIASWIPVSYVGACVALNLFTLALLSDAAIRPVTPSVGTLARAVMGLAIAALIINLALLLNLWG
jgi:hypothetical protein